MKFLKCEAPFGALAERHQQSTGHSLKPMYFWNVDCADCDWGLRRSAWGQPFIINARGGFHLHLAPRS